MEMSDEEIKTLAFNAFNEAFLYIQTRLGVTDGGLAGQHADGTMVSYHRDHFDDFRNVSISEFVHHVLEEYIINELLYLNEEEEEVTE